MKKILSHFFTRRGKFTPPYFWVTLFLCLIVVMLIMKLMGSQHISDTLVLGCLGFVAAWLAVYTWYDKNRMVIRESQAPPPPADGGGYV
jgi:hypothetical protein